MPDKDISNSELARMITEQGKKTDALAQKTDERFDELARMVAEGFSKTVTKEDARLFATKDDLRAVEERMATKDDLATLREDLVERLDRIGEFASDSFDNHEQRIRRVEGELNLPPIPMRSRE